MPDPTESSERSPWAPEAPATGDESGWDVSDPWSTAETPAPFEAVAPSPWVAASDLPDQPDDASAVEDDEGADGDASPWRAWVARSAAARNPAAAVPAAAAAEPVVDESVADDEPSVEDEPASDGAAGDPVVDEPSVDEPTDDSADVAVLDATEPAWADSPSDAPPSDAPAAESAWGDVPLSAPGSGYEPAAVPEAPPLDPPVPPLVTTAGDAFCGECGAHLTPSVAFCGICGAPTPAGLIEAATDAPAAAAVTEIPTGTAFGIAAGPSFESAEVDRPTQSFPATAGLEQPVLPEDSPSPLPPESHAPVEPGIDPPAAVRAGRVAMAVSGGAVALALLVVAILTAGLLVLFDAV